MTHFLPSDRRAVIEQLVRDLPGILSGRIADQHNLAHGLKMRIAFAFFSLIREAYIIKSRGGTDAAGISWPPLDPKYLAYGRGPKSSRRGGGKSPGGRDGMMSKKQLDQWWRDYSQARAWLILQVGDVESRNRAAAIAWSKYKAKGGKTLLDAFGDRPHEILRDSGVLFNSLTPGILAGTEYQPVDNQVVRDEGNALSCGTNVSYAIHHQGTPDKPGKRLLWPADGVLPDVWADDILEVAAEGLNDYITLALAL